MECISTNGWAIAKKVFSTGRLNYLDPNLNVDIPIFAIHGNHDDPAGDGALSAIDILAEAGLLNYFGKHPQVDNLRVEPVVLKKGRTYLALYGMGNVRDERLYRAFKSGGVQMMQATIDGEPDADVFNVLMLHQNRAQHTSKAFVSEQMLPDFLNFVIWGHEHECQCNAHEVAGKEFYVTQPGSSVATSLCEGESREKHYVILEVNRGGFQCKCFKMRTVRPFVMEDLSLTVENVPKHDQEAMRKCLVKRVNSMIDRAKDQNVDMLPLVRLRVEITDDYEKILPQRFAADFVGRVANPEDILVYTKKRSKSDVTENNARSTTAILKARERDAAATRQTVEHEVSRILSSRARHMSIVPESQLAVALTNYVEKEDNTAFAVFLERAFKDAKTHILSRMSEGGLVEATPDIVKAFAEMRVKEIDEKAVSIYDAVAMNLADDEGGAARDEDGAANEDDEDVGEVEEVRVKKELVSKARGAAKAPSPPPAKKKAAAVVPAAKKRAARTEDSPAATKTKATSAKSTKAAARGAVKRERGKHGDEDDDDDDDADIVLDDDDDDDDVPRKKAATPTKKKAAAAPAATTKAKANANSSSSSSNRQAQKKVLSVFCSSIPNDVAQQATLQFASSTAPGDDELNRNLDL